MDFEEISTRFEQYKVSAVPLFNFQHISNDIYLINAIGQIAFHYFQSKPSSIRNKIFTRTLGLRLILSDTNTFHICNNVSIKNVKLRDI